MTKREKLLTLLAMLVPAIAEYAYALIYYR